VINSLTRGVSAIRSLFDCTNGGKFMTNVIDYGAHIARRQASELRANEENMLLGGKAELCIKALASYVTFLLKSDSLPGLDQITRAVFANHADTLICSIRAGHVFGPTDSEFTARALDFYSARSAA
jgi:hypothetical protein